MSCFLQDLEFKEVPRPVLTQEKFLPRVNTENQKKKGKEKKKIQAELILKRNLATKRQVRQILRTELCEKENKNSSAWKMKFLHFLNFFALCCIFVERKSTTGNTHTHTDTILCVLH